MTLRRNLTYALAAAVAAGAGLLAGVVLLKPRAVQPVSGVFLDQPRPIGDFALLDHEGKSFGPEDLKDRWTLLFAGFTHCPDVCPTTLALLKNLESSLGADARALRVLFLTVDPERDTPERMAGYVRYFSPSFVGVTGSLTELDKLTAQLGLAHAKIPGDAPDRYTMDHSAALVLLNPDGRIHGYFSPPFKLEALTSDLRPLLEARA